MNHETLEQAAMKYSDKSNRCRPSIAWVLQDVKDAFIAGATWREQQASKGFEEWLTGRFQVFNNTTFEQEEILYRTAWQASALNSAKLLAEKDAEIKMLRDLSVKSCVCLKLSDELSQAKELLVEKDAEIERLKEILDTINNQLNDTK